MHVHLYLTSDNKGLRQFINTLSSKTNLSKLKNLNKGKKNSHHNQAY